LKAAGYAKKQILVKMPYRRCLSMLDRA